MGQQVMHDESAEEPKPKRRSALRHALGGLALLAVMALNLVLLERGGITDWGSWTRHVRASFRGREQIRKQVVVGMTRKEVEARIGGGSESVTFVNMSNGVGPGPIRQSYPSPFSRIPYREYGFAVVYHCVDIDDRDSWTLLAVENLE